MKIKYSALLAVLISIATVFSIYGNEVQQFQLEFAEDDYRIISQDGLISIGSTNESDFCIPGDPAMPMRQISVAVTPDLAYGSVSIELGTGRTICHGEGLAEALPPCPTNATPSDSPIKRTKFVGDMDNMQIRYLGEDRYQELAILHFAVSPFRFNDNESSLSLNQSVTIEIELTQIDETEDLTNISELAAEMWSNIVINPELIEAAVVPVTPMVLDDDYQLANGGASDLDYVIITNNLLAPYFEDLLNWKRTKGLRSSIITTETISSTYPGSTIQEKIKNCLYSLYKEKGLSYVLLGGDDSIVPSARCKVSCGEYTENSMPTDLYYGCFSKQFNWDKNNNNILGEVDDDCSLTPDIIVTRIPAPTPNLATNIVKKIISYEKNPQIEMNMLMSGASLDGYNSSSKWCDSYLYAANIYNYAISPNWSGSVDFYFDKESNLTVTGTGLLSKFNQGYAFVSVITHGGPTRWYTNIGDDFTTEHVRKITRLNYPGTIVTTTACNTNAFDGTKNNGSMYSGTPCLSQTFLTQLSSGVIAYFGSSRYGWHNENSVYPGSSALYEKSFYKYLFSDPTKNKSFGRIAAMAKLDRTSMCTVDCDYRWLQFSLNPIGDPEMPIFIESPKAFSSVKVYKTYTALNKTNYNIDTGEFGCNVCITGEMNGQQVQAIFRNVKRVTTQLMPSNPTICVTKQNYKPYIIQGTDTFQPFSKDAEIQDNYITDCAFNGNSRTLNVGTEISSLSQSSQLYVTDIMGNVKAVQDLDAEDMVQMDLSSLNPGVYVVTLSVDECPSDSRRIVVK